MITNVFGRFNCTTLGTEEILKCALVLFTRDSNNDGSARRGTAVYEVWWAQGCSNMIFSESVSGRFAAYHSEGDSAKCPFGACDISSILWIPGIVDFIP